MDLLDRYLQAVKFWLPKGQKDDIILELSEDLESQIADQETEIGHALDEAELEPILKRFGNPLVVASRYLPQEHLIGPMFFPIYKFVLKMVGLFYLLPWFLVLAGLVIFSPSYRAAHDGSGLTSGLNQLWTLSFSLFGMITVGFAVAERVQAKTRFLDNWSLRRLPPVRDANRIPRGTSVSEIVSSLICILYWVFLTKPAVVHDDKGAVIPWNPGSVWETLHGTLFWPILLFTLAGMIQGGVNLFRPHWTRLRLGIRGLIHFVGASMLFLVLAPHWIEINEQAIRLTRTHLKPTAAEALQSVTNIAVFATALAAAAIFAAMFLWDLRCVIVWKASPEIAGNGDLSEARP